MAGGELKLIISQSFERYTYTNLFKEVSVVSSAQKLTARLPGAVLFATIVILMEELASVGAYRLVFILFLPAVSVTYRSFLIEFALGYRNNKFGNN